MTAAFQDRGRSKSVLEMWLASRLPTISLLLPSNFIV